MKSTKFLTAGSMILASVMLFAGCAGITHEPEVDVNSLKEIDEQDFFKALEAIGIEEGDTEIMEDSSFSFSGEDIDYEVEYCIDAYADNENYYSYVKCVDEETAMALFEYYYKDYKDIFDAKDFSGISSHEVGSDTAYVLIDGRYDDKAANTYTPYHDAIFLKGDTLVIAIASDYDLAIEKEVNTFLDALGYPHP